MRKTVLFGLLSLLFAVGASAQCGPNGNRACQPGKVPDPGAFGGDYSVCTAVASQHQFCWVQAFSVYFAPDGSAYVVAYCAPSHENAACYCAQGEGEVLTSGVCLSR